DLLMVQETNPQQAVEHLPRELGGVPDVSDLEARDKGERIRPIGARVRRNGSLGVALGAVLEVARLGRATAVEPGAITPLGVELDAIRGISHHQEWPAVTQNLRHRVRTGRIAAQHTVWAAKPDVAWLGCCDIRQRWSSVGLFVIHRQAEQAVNLTPV